MKEAQTPGARPMDTAPRDGRWVTIEEYNAAVDLPSLYRARFIDGEWRGPYGEGEATFDPVGWLPD